MWDLRFKMRCTLNTYFTQMSCIICSLISLANLVLWPYDQHMTSFVRKSLATSMLLPKPFFKIRHNMVKRFPAACVCIFRNMYLWLRKILWNATFVCITQFWMYSPTEIKIHSCTVCCLKGSNCFCLNIILMSKMF